MNGWVILVIFWLFGALMYWIGRQCARDEIKRLSHEFALDELEAEIAEFENASVEDVAKLYGSSSNDDGFICEKCDRIFTRCSCDHEEAQARVTALESIIDQLCADLGMTEGEARELLDGVG
jgi:hypothetical protein